MKRVVYLPQGRQVTVGDYVRAWKLAITAPEGAVFTKAFNWYPETKCEVLREFRRGLHDASIGAYTAFLAPSDLKLIPTHANTIINGKSRLSARQLNSINHDSSFTACHPG